MKIVFYVSDAYIGADVLASRASGIPAYWKGRPLGWYSLDYPGEFQGPYETREDAARCEVAK